MKITYFIFIFLLPLFVISQDIEISGNGRVESNRDRTFNFKIEVDKMDDLSFRSVQLSLSNYQYSKLTYNEISSHQSQRKPFSIDPHTNENKGKNELISSLIFIEEETEYIIFEIITSEFYPILDYTYTIHYQTPILKPQAVQYSTDCICPPPDYFNREAWGCPWGEDSSIFIPEYSEISHIVVHHSASIPQKPYASAVKSIWNYHVNGNGWSDIGYHWLIDPDGGIFKGRAWLDGDENIQGAHMCACNSNKMGICLLGDFTINEPTTEQYNALINFLASKTCQLDIEPILTSDGTSRISGTCSDEMVNNMIGHRDGCPPSYTACPGDAFYPNFEILKEDVQLAYEDCLSDISSQKNLNQNFKIYPNPNNGEFMIESDKLTFSNAPTIYNLQMKKINFSTSISDNKMEIRMPDTPGIYIFKLNNIIQKFVIH